jgi:hypothetical protein
MADEVIVVFGAELDGYNAQIKSAIGANDKLEQSANDTSAQITKDFANSGKAIQQAFGGQQVSKSLDQTKKSAVELKAQIKALYDEEVRLLRISKNVATDGVGAVRKEAALLRSQLPGLNGELGKTGTAIEQASKKGQTLTAQLRGLKNEINQLDAAGQGGSKAFTDLTIQAARLEDQIGDTRERVRVLASDTFKFDAAVQGVQAVAGAFAGAQGAIALFGGESEEVEKALLKVQAALALVAAAQEFSNLVTGQGPLKLALQTTATQVYTASTAAAASTTTAFGVAVNTTSTSFKVLRGAIIASGIGLLIYGVALAIKAFNDLNKSTEEQIKNQARLAKAGEDAQRQLGDATLKRLAAEGKITEDQAKRIEIKNEVIRKQNENRLAFAKELNRLEKERQEAEGDSVRLVGIFRQREQAEKNYQTVRLAITRDGQAQIAELNKKEVADTKDTAEEKIKIERNFQEVSGQLILAQSKKRFADIAVLEAETNLLRNKDSIEAQDALIKAKLKADLLGYELEYQAALKSNEDLDAAKGSYLAKIKLAEQKAADETLALTKDTNTKKLESDEEYTTATISLAERIAAARAKSEKLTFDQSVQLTNELFSLQSAIADNKIARLEENAAKEIQLAGDDAQQKAGIERKLADEVAEIKRRQAIADKAQALFNIAIQTAQAVASALKLGPGAPAAVALAVAIGAIQAATVAARPIPKFEKGGLVKGPRHSQGGVIAELEGDEYITNRTATKRNRPLLEAINTGKEKEYIYKRFQVPIIQANQSAAINQKLNAKLDSARMERELQLNRKADSKNTNKIIKAVTNNKSPRYNWN